MQELITIHFSHYCEKARWGLDLVGKPYREHGHLPMFHFLPVALATRGAPDKGGDKVSTKNSTPVLITDDGRRICDSSRILQHLCAEEGLALYEDPEALALDAFYSAELGPHTRRYGYHHILANDRVLRRFLREVGGRVEAGAAVALRRPYVFAMRKALNINAKSAERSRKKVETIAGDVDQRLSDGRAYLCGDHFSGADLSFSAMIAPGLMLGKDEGYGSLFPTMNAAGGALRDFALSLRQRPSGQFALKIYREERGSSAAVA